MILISCRLCFAHLNDFMTPGILYIVATPIGNLEDITLRAIRILKQASVIAAEDTRRTKKLLDRYGIETPLTSYHDHNKEDKAPLLVAKLLEGHDVALVSDAGTPGISDPGYYLIRLTIGHGLRAAPVPGPVAAVAALSISGLPTDRFAFEGFLPSRRGQRLKRLYELSDDERTLIFYEAPHRVISTIEDMLAAFGDRKAVVTRELTKIHEEVVRLNLSDMVKKLKEGSVKGEFTIIVHGAEKKPGKEEAPDLKEYLKDLMLHRGLSKKEAVAAAAEELGLPKKAVYQESLKLEK